MAFEIYRYDKEYIKENYNFYGILKLYMNDYCIDVCHSDDQDWK